MHYCFYVITIDDWNKWCREKQTEQQGVISQACCYTPNKIQSYVAFKKQKEWIPNKMYLAYRSGSER